MRILDERPDAPVVADMPSGPVPRAGARPRASVFIARLPAHRKTRKTGKGYVAPCPPFA